MALIQDILSQLQGIAFAPNDAKEVAAAADDHADATAVPVTFADAIVAASAVFPNVALII